METVKTHRQAEVQGQEKWNGIKRKRRQRLIPGKLIQGNPKESFVSHENRFKRRRSRASEG